MDKKDLFYIALVVIASALVGLFSSREADGGMRVTYDTVTVHDTVTIVMPEVTSTRLLGYRQARVRVSEPVVVRDTVRDTVMDSVVVELPITQRVYADSLYTAWVSGHEPRLDSIRLYPVTNYIYETITKKEYTRRKNFSIGLGVGYGFDGKKVSPYVGIGVHWKILEW